MVSDVAGVAGIADEAVAIDDERPWHLEGVTHRFLNVVALSGGLDAADYRGGPQDLEEGPTLEAEGLIARAARVGQTGERSLEAVAEGLSLLRVTLSDGNDVAACGSDLVGALTELFQVLPTERSAEVAKEGEYQGAIAPKLSKRDLAAIPPLERCFWRWLTDFSRHSGTPPR